MLGPLADTLDRREPTTVAVLTVLLATTIVSSPLLTAFPIVGDALITGSVIAAIAVVGRSPRWLLAAALLGLVKIAEIWTAPGIETRDYTGVLYAFVIGDTLLLLLVLRVVEIVYRGDRDLPTRLTAAVAGYLMGIVLFANLHMFVLAHDPDAITAASGAPITSANTVYFSVVTQTTLGYGDLTPASPIARSLTMAQSILGVLYVAVTIAGLVGTRATQSNPTD